MVQQGAEYRQTIPAVSGMERGGGRGTCYASSVEDGLFPLQYIKLGVVILLLSIDVQLINVFVRISSFIFS